MLKIGDRVYPFNHMSNVGVIVEVRRSKSNTWLVGGTTGDVTTIVVKHDNTLEIKEYKASDLMRVD
jgi:hypothetical protein